MQSILITYDLVGTDETSADYKRLIDHIKNGYSNWAKIALSTWVVRTDQSAKQVRDNCDAYLDANDRLFVAVLTGVAAWRNTICTSEWLKNNL
jgi:hypothetical protein